MGNVASELLEKLEEPSEKYLEEHNIEENLNDVYDRVCKNDRDITFEEIKNAFPNKNLYYNECSSLDLTILGIAVRGNNVRIVRELLENGFDPNKLIFAHVYGGEKGQFIPETSPSQFDFLKNVPLYSFMYSDAHLEPDIEVLKELFNNVMTNDEHKHEILKLAHKKGWNMENIENNPDAVPCVVMNPIENSRAASSSLRHRINCAEGNYDKER